MTRQEIFDKVADHLMMQGQKSISRIGNNIKCLYRTSDGLKCAIGCLIPDDLYSPGIEGSHVISRVIESILMEAGILSEDYSDRVKTLQLLSDLQNIHDSVNPSSWKGRLKEYAREHNLEDNLG